MFWAQLLDKSIDVNNNSRLAVVARYCSNGEVHQKLCCLKPMYGTTKEKDILDFSPRTLEERKIDICEIFSVTTDGGPVMMGNTLDLLLWLSKRLGTLLWSCTVLFIKKVFVQRFKNSALHDVMSTVTKIESFLVAHSATTHRQFWSLLEKMESA